MTCPDSGGMFRLIQDRPRVAANGAAPLGAEASAVTRALRRAPSGAVRGQDPPVVLAQRGHSIYRCARLDATCYRLMSMRLEIEP